MNNEKYNCNHCNKTYSGYRSLWGHNKMFHNGIKTEITIIEHKPKIIDTTEYMCRVCCNKKYKHKQTRCRHEKTCKGIKQTDKEIELEVEKTKQETEKMKQETLKLQIKLQGMKRMNTKTFKTMNKFLMDRSTQNITNNTQIININLPNILSMGKENLIHNLSRNEKIMILDSRHNSIEKMIEIVHCGTHNRFKNIIITNLKDKFAYRYDDKKGYFITENKSDLLDNLIMYRVMDIEAIYDELSSANKIDSRTKKLIQEFLDKMDNEEPFIYDTVEYPNFKCYKMNNIKILLYNNHDKITKDIAFLIGDSKKEGEIPKNEIIS